MGQSGAGCVLLCNRHRYPRQAVLEVELELAGGHRGSQALWRGTEQDCSLIGGPWLRQGAHGMGKLSWGPVGSPMVPCLAGHALQWGQHPALPSCPFALSRVWCLPWGRGCQGTAEQGQRVRSCTHRGIPSNGGTHGVPRATGAEQLGQSICA